MSWTEERVERLKQRWAKGDSASQIAAELGGGLTRNSVIGKVHRIGLAGRPRSGDAPTRKPRAQTTVRVPKIKAMIAKPNGSFTPVFERPPAVTVVAEPEAPEPLKLTFEQLGAKTCRFPYGDPQAPDFFYCGVPDADFPDIAYCKFHHRYCGGGFGNHSPKRGVNQRRTA